MKAVLLSSPNHQADTKKCPHPLPSLHRHHPTRPYHFCWGWFQHHLIVQMGQIDVAFRFRHLGGRRPRYWCLELCCTMFTAYNRVREASVVLKGGGKHKQIWFDLCLCTKWCLLTNSTIAPAAAGFITECHPHHTQLLAFGHKREAAASSWG